MKKICSINISCCSWIDVIQEGEKYFIQFWNYAESRIKTPLRGTWELVVDKDNESFDVVPRNDFLYSECRSTINYLFNFED